MSGLRARNFRATSLGAQTDGEIREQQYCELQFPLNSSCMTSAVIGGDVLTVERR